MKNALKHLDELYLSTMQINMALYNICNAKNMQGGDWVQSAPGLDRNTDTNTKLRNMKYKTRCRKEMGCNQSQVGTQKVAQEEGNYCQPCRPRSRSSCQAPTFQPCSSRSRSTTCQASTCQAPTCQAPTSQAPTCHAAPDPDLLARLPIQLARAKLSGVGNLSPVQTVLPAT